MIFKKLNGIKHAVGKYTVVPKKMNIDICIPRYCIMIKKHYYINKIEGFKLDYNTHNGYFYEMNDEEIAYFKKNLDKYKMINNQEFRIYEVLQD